MEVEPLVWCCPKCRCEYSPVATPNEYRCYCGKQARSTASFYCQLKTYTYPRADMTTTLARLSYMSRSQPQKNPFSRDPDNTMLA